MRLASLLAVIAACSCAKDGAKSGVDAGDRVAAASAVRDTSTYDAAGPGSDAGSAPRAGAALPTQADAGIDGATRSSWAFDCDDVSAPRGGKSIGHTSAVFKLELASGKKVAWKPSTKKMRGRYKGEVAAFRLASALAIDNVLPACPRVFDEAVIRQALTPNEDAATLLANEAIVENGKIYGASIMWLDGLSFWPLEKEPLRTEARAWLTAGTEIPAVKVDLARQVSTLVLFDFITGNWDRYSGENVGRDKAGATVLYVDNDAAFMEEPPKALIARNKALLDATDRFSREVIAHLRVLDDASLARAFGDESPGRPLLSKAIVSLVARRAKELLAVVDAKIGSRGEADTLYFR